MPVMPSAACQNERFRCHTGKCNPSEQALQGKGAEGGQTVFEAQILNCLQIKIITIKRFGCGSLEIVVRHIDRDNIIVDFTGCSDAAFVIEVATIMPAHPLIHQAIGGAGIHGHQAFIGNGGDIGHAAEIDNHQRQVEFGILHQRLMINRHQWRRLPACLDIRLTEITDHRHTGHIGEGLAIEQLYGPAFDTRFRSLMQDGLTMGTQHIEIAETQAIARQEFACGPKVTLHDRPARLVKDRRLRLTTRPRQSGLDRPLQKTARLHGHRHFSPGTKGQLGFPIGFQYGHIDAIKRCSGHKTQHFHHGGPLMS